MYSNPLNVTVKEIAWLAGIIEGESHIGYYRTPQVKIKMTDKDVVDRVARLFRCNVSEFREGNHKTSYTATASGYKAIEWLLTTYSFLGNRRKYEAIKTINEWEKSGTYQRGVNRFYLKGKEICRLHGPIEGANRINTSTCYGCSKATVDRIRKSQMSLKEVN